MDWQAINFVVTGARVVALTGDERLMVLRRLTHRIVEKNTTSLYPPPGKLTALQLAQRFGMDKGCKPESAQRRIERLKEKLLPADERTCPVCHCQCWVLKVGVVEAHPDSFMNECPMSGRGLDDLDDTDLLALQVQWMAGRVRAGDSDGIWARFRDLDADRQRAVLIAALAAVPEVDADDLYAWTEAS